MKSAIQKGGAFSYMGFKGYNNAKQPLPTVEEIGGLTDMDDALKALMLKHGRQQQQRRKR